MRGKLAPAQNTNVVVSFMPKACLASLDALLMVITCCNNSGILGVRTHDSMVWQLLSSRLDAFFFTRWENAMKTHSTYFKNSQVAWRSVLSIKHLCSVQPVYACEIPDRLQLSQALSKCLGGTWEVQPRPLHQVRCGPWGRPKMKYLVGLVPWSLKATRMSDLKRLRRTISTPAPWCLRLLPHIWSTYCRWTWHWLEWCIVAAQGIASTRTPCTATARCSCIRSWSLFLAMLYELYVILYMSYLAMAYPWPIPISEFHSSPAPGSSDWRKACAREGSGANRQRLWSWATWRPKGWSCWDDLGCPT